MDKLIESLDAEFASVHQASCELLSRLSSESLYARAAVAPQNGSCGEQILRSAATVEQSFGGLTANLWDSPFEWTLPETLNTPAKVHEYLNEVENTRQRAFEAFSADEDLEKEIMTPSGEVKLRSFLLDTLQRARHHQQRAMATFEILKPAN